MISSCVIIAHTVGLPFIQRKRAWIFQNLIKSLMIFWIFQRINILIKISIIKLFKINFVDIICSASPWEITFIEVVYWRSYYSNSPNQWWISFSYSWIVKITLRSVSYYILDYEAIHILFFFFFFYHWRWLLLFIFQFFFIHAFNLYFLLFGCEVFQFEVYFHNTFLGSIFKFNIWLV